MKVQFWLFLAAMDAAQAVQLEKSSHGKSVEFGIADLAQVSVETSTDTSCEAEAEATIEA